MQCPKCQFDHPAQTTECLKCGIVFVKYQRYQAALKTLPRPIDEAQGPPVTLQEAREELTYRLLALPVALLVALLLVGSPFAPLVRIFVSMLVHETGHAVTAWRSIPRGLPGPKLNRSSSRDSTGLLRNTATWKTPISSWRFRKPCRYR